MKHLYTVALMLFPLLIIDKAIAQAITSDKVAEQVAIKTCAICHGAQGRSVSPKFPVLAGQQLSYLTTQLQDFRSHTRGDPDAVGYMWGMAAPLSDDLIVGLANYFSKQMPTRNDSIGTKSINSRGKEIYEHGDPNSGTVACSTCHGANGAGAEAFPRLAGQHSQYLVSQLLAYQNNLRGTDVMRTVIQGLKPADMQAVAAYLQSLGR